MEKVKGKLPKAFKNKWIKALLSDEYKQGQYVLHNKRDHTFCCLGVACNIAGIPVNKINGGTITTSLASKSKTKIPDIIVGTVEQKPLVDKLSNFNDKGKSFKWIAGYIKRYL